METMTRKSMRRLGWLNESSTGVRAFDPSFA
jgi:hypothetical protein